MIHYLFSWFCFVSNIFFHLSWSICIIHNFTEISEKMFWSKYYKYLRWTIHKTIRLGKSTIRHFKREISPGWVVFHACFPTGLLCCYGRPRQGRTVAVQITDTARDFRPTSAVTRNFLRGLCWHQSRGYLPGCRLRTVEGSHRPNLLFREDVLNRSRHLRCRH